MVGLLVDPGAHDNLVGERTLADMAGRAKEKPHMRTLRQPMAAEGIGKNAQTAEQAGVVSIGIEGSRGAHTAPIVLNSILPPL